MDVTIWVHDDDIDGVKPVAGTLSKEGQFIHIRFAGIHLAIKGDDIESAEGDDGK